MKNQLIGKENKKWMIGIIVIIVSFVLSVVVSCLMGNNIKQCVKDYIYGKGAASDEKIIEPNQIRAINYLVEGNRYTSENADPQLVLGEVNEYVESITVYFSEKTDSSINLELFYSTATEGFSQDKMFTAKVNENLDKLKIPVHRKVSGLRLDIGTEKDVHFSLKRVYVNEGYEKPSVQRVVKCMKENFGTKIWIERFKIFFIICLFISMHFLIPIDKMYSCIFDKRWMIAGLLLLFLVINKYHGDSMAMFDYYVQTGEGSDYSEPIIGVPRAIRSDEWVVSTPRDLSTRFLDNPYGRYNNIIRGTETFNTNQLAVFTIYHPIFLIRTLITEVAGFEYGFSFSWYAPIFLAFLFLLELFLIISKDSKLLSVCGAFMVVFSSYFMWWIFPTVIMTSSAALVCAYHFVIADRWRLKIPCAIGTGMFTTYFILILYPAWQVPLGYIVLAILIWMIHDLWGKIKKMSKAEWGTIITTLFLCSLIIVLYMRDRREYTDIISKTVYPGARVDYGGFSIGKLFNYIIGVLFPYTNYENPSESGVCIGFFPVPMLMIFILWIRSKKKDWLVSGLLLVGLFLMLYTTVGLPPFVARILLMTYSTSGRAVDMLGFLQVIFFVIIFSRYREEKGLPNIIAIILAAISSVSSVWLANYFHPAYMGKIYILISSFVIFFVMFSCLVKRNDRIQKIMLLTVIGISLITGVYVRPIMKGFDAIYSKPLANEIIEICSEDKNAKWLAYGGGVVLPSYAVACGASTINSVNTYPNMALWEKLDPTGQYNDVYNRFEHIALEFVEGNTTFELVQPDCIRLNLAYQDFSITGAKYIVSLKKLNIDNENLSLEEIYNESGSYIYKILYKENVGEN